MSSFSILKQVTTPGRIFDQFADTAITTTFDAASNAASATITTRSGLLSPLRKTAAAFVYPPIGGGALTLHRGHSNIATATGPAQDAIKALHLLADQHGIAGAQAAADGGTAGLAFRNDPTGSVSWGTSVQERLGADTVAALTRAVDDVIAAVRPHA